MKSKLQTSTIYFLILSLFIFGCSPAISAPVTPDDLDLPLASTSTTLPATTPTAILTPTVAPTATVYPPVYDPETIGDNRVLDSFILTRKDTTTGGGEVKEDHITIGYIKEPFSAYRLGKYLYPGGGKEAKKFLIDGRLYEGFSSGEWFFTQEASPKDVDFYFQSAAKMGLFSSFVISAQFVGQEDFEGVPANHFAFDETNLREDTDPTGTYKVDAAVGDLYLAQDGNYLLYFHLKLIGNVGPIYGEPGYGPGVREMTEALSSINQLTEIAVPADFDLELDLGFPLPEGSTLFGIIAYRDGFIPDLYTYTTPGITYDELIEFYESMTPTNGWSFSHIGQITNNVECDTTFTGNDEDCVILKKGNAQVILYYKEGGYIGADYER